MNNVAIGAAHARRFYGNDKHIQIKGASRIERIAIVDFDIHEYVLSISLLCFSDVSSGNGTSDILRNLKPNMRKYPLPESWAPREYRSYKPWLTEDDSDYLFFSSIHLFEPSGTFYPGSGKWLRLSYSLRALQVQQMNPQKQMKVLLLLMYR